MILDLMMRPVAKQCVRLTKAQADHHWVALRRWIKDQGTGTYRIIHLAGIEYQIDDPYLGGKMYIFSDSNTAFAFKMTFT